MQGISGNFFLAVSTAYLSACGGWWLLTRSYPKYSTP